MRAVVQNLENDREPHTQRMRVWQRWAISWALMFIQHYNRHDMAYFREQTRVLLHERDEALARAGHADSE